MNLGLLLFASSVVIFLLILRQLYLSTVKKTRRVSEVYLSIYAISKQRYELIPEILAIVKKYTDDKNEPIEELNKLYVRALTIPDNYENIKIKFNLDDEIKNKMRKLLSSINNYPKLKSDPTMDIAIKTYNKIDKDISNGREFFNTVIYNFNNTIDKFPYSIFSKILKIQKIDLENI